MAKVRLTKNELKKQKDDLKRFVRYLPTLILKKQQIQMEIRRIEAQRRQKRDQEEQLLNDISGWVNVFGEEVGLDEIMRIDSLRLETGNIAGIDIPLFQGVDFDVSEYSLFELPLWVDTAVETLQELITLDAELWALEEQIRLLGEELRVTTQRVNLFEKVKIPEAQEAIRVIQIYLGDQQTAAVVRGKISKNKIVREAQI
jgi:V/A-type H+-transporting ATPase subunit D